MSAEELMLGDWVLMKDKSYKVASLPSIGNPELESDKYIFHCLKDEIVPIPLTPKILEKNFPKKDFVYWEENEGCELYHIHIERCFQEFNGFLKYVHELQHALRLCGINKEVEI